MAAALSDRTVPPFTTTFWRLHLRSLRHRSFDGLRQVLDRAIHSALHVFPRVCRCLIDAGEASVSVFAKVANTRECSIADGSTLRLRFAGELLNLTVEVRELLTDRCGESLPLVKAEVPC